MDESDGDLLRHAGLMRRATLCGGGGVALFALTIGYLANAARYWTLHPELVAGAAYVSSGVLVFLGVVSWMKARSVRARMMAERG